MLRVVIGLLKGALVGGAVGYGLLHLGWTSGFIAYLACAVVGAGVGLVAGRAPWRAETLWTPLVKLIVGAAVGVGLCAVGYKVLPDPSLHLAGVGAFNLHSGAALAPIVGVLYGIFVEVDDGGGKPEPDKKRERPKAG
jgi:hypothetical protein